MYVCMKVHVTLSLSTKAYQNLKSKGNMSEYVESLLKDDSGEQILKEVSKKIEKKEFEETYKIPFSVYEYIKNTRFAKINDIAPFFPRASEKELETIYRLIKGILQNEHEN